MGGIWASFMAWINLRPISTRVSPGGRAEWAGRSSHVKATCWAAADAAVTREARAVARTRRARPVFIRMFPPENIHVHRKGDKTGGASLHNVDEISGAFAAAGFVANCVRGG